MKLSNNFYLHEFTRSQTAIRMGIDNIPNSEAINSLTLLCENVLQPLREKYKKPLHIASGFRCASLNSLIGGAHNSQHTKGEAADIDSQSDNLFLFETLSNMEFDQLIFEFGEHTPEWVHVSYVTYRKNRHQILRAYRDEYGTHYAPYILHPVEETYSGE